MLYKLVIILPTSWTERGKDNLSHGCFGLAKEMEGWMCNREAGVAEESWEDWTDAALRLNGGHRWQDRLQNVL